MNNSRGRALLKWAAQHRLVVLNDGTTPVSGARVSHRFIPIQKILLELLQDENLETLSNHKYITMKINSIGWVRLDNSNKKQSYVRNFKKMDEDLFKVVIGTWQENRTFESSEMAANCVERILKQPIHPCLK